MEEVSIKTQKRLIDIMLDNPTLIKVGEKEYKIKDLTKYSLLKICEVYLKCKETEEDIESILEECATNLRYQAEIIAIILLNHTFTEDTDDNEMRIKKMTSKVLLDSTVEDEWSLIIMQAISSMNVQEVFMNTALIKVLAATMKKRKETVVQSLSTQPQS